MTLPRCFAFLVLFSWTPVVAADEIAPFIYAGAAVLSPALFVDAPQAAFPLTRLFDRAAAAGRLFGLPLDGVWMHVGTPEAVTAAEAALAAIA